MKVNNLVKGIMAVSLLIFTASCEEENESLQGGNSDNNTQTTDTHVAVDLGLSVKWATCNVGASRPEDYGGYYAWGETEEKDTYWWRTYKYWNDKNGDNSPYDYDSTLYVQDKVDVLEIVQIGDDISGTEYDVAHVKWGNGWRMPNANEIMELIVQCTWTWSTKGGFVVTGPNGKSIFLPAASFIWGDRHDTYEYDLFCGVEGNYWSATAYGGDAAYSLNFQTDTTIVDVSFELEEDIYMTRYRRGDIGFSVRPVKD